MGVSKGNAQCPCNPPLPFHVDVLVWQNTEGFRTPELSQCTRPERGCDVAAVQAHLEEADRTLGPWFLVL